MSFRIRIASLNDMQWMFSMRASVGRNPGLHESLIFYVTDPTGFFIGTLNGKAIAYVSAVKYQNFAYFGNMFVDKEYRKKKYAHTLVLHALDTARGYRIGAGAIVEQMDYATSLGFKFTSNITYYSGVISKIPLSDSEKIVDAKTVPFDQLLQYDRLHFPDERKVFLSALLSLNRGLVYMDNGFIRGFGVIFKCIGGYKIGPLFADNINIAESLVHALYRPFMGSELFMYCPECNVNAIELAVKLQLKFILSGAIYYGDTDVRLGNIYCVATTEIG